MTISQIPVIDDDSGVRDAFRIALQDKYEVMAAENGEAGIALAKLHRPDLIFLDLKMPGMDGIEALRRLMQHDASLRVYIVTAFAQEYMAGLQLAKNDGLRFQLAAKPLSGAQILAIAESVLDS